MAGTSSRTMKNLTLQLSDRVGYVPRTGENVAQSDVTLAIASDFSTAGERLTLKIARAYHKPIVQVPHYTPDLMLHVGKFISVMNRDGNRGLTLNGAGNGVYTLPSKTQAEADRFALLFLQTALNSPDRAFTLALVRSGGQTGYDVAIVKAALSLGVPALIHCARSVDGKFLIRAEDGRDYGLTEAEYRYSMGLSEG